MRRLKCSGTVFVILLILCSWTWPPAGAILIRLLFAVAGKQRTIQAAHDANRGSGARNPTIPWVNNDLFRADSGRCNIGYTFTLRWLQLRMSLDGDEMILSRETRDLAQRLSDYEAAAGDASEPKKSAGIRVCEKLRLPLSAIVGVADYRTLLSRALTLAKLEAPSLDAVQLTTDGSLQDLSDTSSQVDQQRVGEGGVILLAQLLGLFLTFFGAALTVQLVEDVTPALRAIAESSTPLPLEDILREVVELKNVCCRLESLADDHPLVEDALMSISGNIRNTATTLEVLTVIRSKSGGPQKAERKKQSKRYLM